ncbi:MAG: phosphate acyltransferase [Defluviitaleaceae bacterium]|nr:phosphate acyltransferase [Defluviitaleaceae bacterium]
MKNFEELIKLASSKKSKIAVAAASDENVLEACLLAYERNLADFILIGDKEKILKTTVGSSNISNDKFEILDEKDMAKASEIAVSLVKENKASALMKGLVDTSIILKAALHKENGIRTDRKLSHLAAFEVKDYHKLLFLTDAAINIAPTLEDKKSILENAVLSLNNLGFSPKVALLAAKEKVDPKMPVTLEYEEIVKDHKNGFLPKSSIEGPLALDNAVSKEACEIKGIKTEIGGDVDLLFTPNIESGNVLYKSLTFLAGAKTGGVVLGAQRPIILTSRSDSAEAKLLSIALSLVF